MWKPAVILAAVMELTLLTRAAQAAEMYPWRQHARPFSFLFGNEIDAHQQSSQAGDGSLKGYLYVRYTGLVTKDGYAVATHADCNTVTDCLVGWTFAAKAAQATLVRQPMHDHPVFWIERADIPQPGSYSHFHWTGMAMPMPYLPAAGYLLEMTAINTFCFIHHGGEAAMSSATCRENGGLKVNRGVDIATHLNIVTSDPSGR